MFKGFEYNKEWKVFKDRSIYAEEHKILCDFLTSDNENVQLEYSTDIEACNATQALKVWCKKNHKPLKINQRHQYVIAVKRERVTG